MERSGGGEEEEEAVPVTSLMVSPAKPSSQALSPIRKTTASTHGREETSSTQVHSAVVVKSSEVEFPVQFHELQSNTDLKMPPSNWLQDHSSMRLPNPTQRPADFSSFFMAHQFPDCVGEVDVVSTAENIKKLLKIPYNPKAHVSMMIHRVGKTLLIDDFDIYKYLLRQSEKEWHWLRKFFFEHVLQSLAHKENVLVRPNKSRQVVQNRSLLSKFLYHSINDHHPTSPSPQPPHQPQSITHTPISVHTPSAVVSEGMPEPSLEEQLPHTTSQAFTRNVVWNFEDLHMLIGTDLPIFGGGIHPCVSLRLHDMNKPINILTGIDYWLDNLMCNVPEVVMCYHLDGIVQKYQLIKTEDLPHTAECQFSPRLVRDVAQNILAFLNSKATKEGHTYWLFKGKDDDIVKLYDLTSLCVEGRVRVDGSEEEESGQGSHQGPSDNPFTVPVAMLFYRVAKNMRASEDADSKIPTIRALLTNALSLLDNHQYPKIVSSAHYMLSDLYVPQDVDPDSPTLSDCSEDDSEWSSVHGNSDDDDDEDEGDDTTEKRSGAFFSQYSHSSHTSSSVTTSTTASSIKVATLCKSQATRTHPHYYKAPPLLGSLEERCLNALGHVTQALRCLHSSTDTHRQTSPGPAPTTTPKDHKEEPKMARPFQPIPMPYSPLHPQEPQDSKRAVVPSKQQQQQQNSRSQQQQQRDQLTVSVLNHQYSVATWWDKLHILLLRKASLIYLVMARANFNDKKYGMALRYLRFSLHAWQGMTCRLGVGTGSLPAPAQALTLAGDIFYMMARHWQDAPTHVDAYNTVSDIHQEMLALLDNIIPAQECSGVIKLPCDVEEALTLSSASLEAAITTSHSEAAIMLSRRLGNVCNELGVMYMNQAAKLCEESEVGFEGGEELWRQSREFLRRGLESFTRAQDTPNVALLHSNTGRLLRLCAFYCSSRNSPQAAEAERRYYQQALKEYQRALEVLVCRRHGEEIWDLVVWEYCTTLYTFASILHDHSTHAAMVREVPREVVDLLNKALKYCDVNAPGPRQPLYQYRAAVIYMRLAGMYRDALRHGWGESKKMRHLSEVNYKKAAGLFLLLENPVDIMKVQLDRVMLLEEQIQGTSSPQTLYRLHLSILQLLVECQPALKLLQPAPASTPTPSVPTTTPSPAPTPSTKAKIGQHKRGEKRKTAKQSVDKVSDEAIGQEDGQSYSGSPTATTPTSSSSTSTSEVQNGPIPCTTSPSNSEKNHTRSEKEEEEDKGEVRVRSEQHQEESQVKSEEESRTRSEEEEGRARSEELLEILERKLHGSLMALIKVARKGGTGGGDSTSGTLKQMYSASLNVRSVPLPSHLLAATTTITPLLRTLPQRR